MEKGNLVPVVLRADADCQGCGIRLKQGSTVLWDGAEFLSHEGCGTRTKVITLSFNVPADLDTPSETLAAMKQLVIDALQEKVVEHMMGRRRMVPQRVALIGALLTES